jgi:hypothetical protein
MKLWRENKVNQEWEKPNDEIAGELNTIISVRKSKD